MKTIFTILTLCLFFSCGKSESNKQVEKVRNENIIKLINEEKRVLEVVVTDSNIVYVSLKGDGKSQKGFAEYICQLITDQMPKVNRVKIVEHGTTKHPKKDNAYGILLGESNCKF